MDTEKGEEKGDAIFIYLFFLTLRN